MRCCRSSASTSRTTLWSGPSWRTWYPGPALARDGRGARRPHGPGGARPVRGRARRPLPRAASLGVRVRGADRAADPVGHRGRATGGPHHPRPAGLGSARGGHVLRACRNDGSALAPRALAPRAARQRPGRTAAGGRARPARRPAPPDLPAARPGSHGARRLGSRGGRRCGRRRQRPALPHRRAGVSVGRGAAARPARRWPVRPRPQGHPAGARRGAGAGGLRHRDVVCRWARRRRRRDRARLGSHTRVGRVVGERGGHPLGSRRPRLVDLHPRCAPRRWAGRRLAGERARPRRPVARCSRDPPRGAR